MAGAPWVRWILNNIYLMNLLLQSVYVKKLNMLSDFLLVKGA